MANPWTKKNPLLSMWLSGANALAGKARSAGMTEMKRQQTSSTKQAAPLLERRMAGRRQGQTQRPWLIVLCSAFPPDPDLAGREPVEPA